MSNQINVRKVGTEFYEISVQVTHNSVEYIVCWYRENSTNELVCKPTICSFHPVTRRTRVVKGYTKKGDISPTYAAVLVAALRECQRIDEANGARVLAVA
jgi:hypothetical protein